MKLYDLHRVKNVEPYASTNSCAKLLKFVEMMVCNFHLLLLVMVRVLIIVILGHGLTTDRVNATLLYSRWLWLTYLFMWTHNPPHGGRCPSHELCIDTQLMPHLYNTSIHLVVDYLAYGHLHLLFLLFMGSSSILFMCYGYVDLVFSSWFHSILVYLLWTQYGIGVGVNLFLIESFSLQIWHFLLILGWWMHRSQFKIYLVANLESLGK